MTLRDSLPDSLPNGRPINSAASLIIDEAPIAPLGPNDQNAPQTKAAQKPRDDGQDGLTTVKIHRSAYRRAKIMAAFLEKRLAAYLDALIEQDCRTAPAKGLELPADLRP